MSAHAPGLVRAVALVGPTGVGKTSLMEALLIAAGARAARNGAPGTTLGDSSPEARARGHSVELNFAAFEFLDDRYALIDCPGARSVGRVRPGQRRPGGGPPDADLERRACHRLHGSRPGARLRLRRRRP